MAKINYWDISVTGNPKIHRFWEYCSNVPKDVPNFCVQKAFIKQNHDIRSLFFTIVSILFATIVAILNGNGSISHDSVAPLLSTRSLARDFVCTFIEKYHLTMVE